MDKNFTTNETADENSVVWYEATPDKFDFYGILKERDEIMSHRVPQEIAEKISKGVEKHSRNPSGGRIRFSTNSSFIALKVEYGFGEVPTVCNHCLTHGFDLYVSGEEGKEAFKGVCRPVPTFDYKFHEYKINTKNQGENRFYTLNFPLFTEIEKLCIGIEKGSTLGKGAPYVNSAPVVFYGSSITHGAAASRPGNTYENFISQKYNLNYINLGFSGNAKGEPLMAEYIASLDMTAFVCDYDHNTPDVEHLEKTHYPFYETIRKKHPDIPYIMVTAPDYFRNPESFDKRADVIYESYKKAVANGDKNVYFIHGKELFDGSHPTSCTSDGCHPNDIGFFRMAEKIGGVIAEVMGL